MSDEFHPGQLVPGTPYRVLAPIGKGGMGSVYEVEHEELGKRFVLKALLRELVARDDLVQRLRNEWRSLGRLEHPNIVSVTDAGMTADGTPYYVMERLRGEHLGARMRRFRRLPLEQSLSIAAEVLDGLDAAHRIGVVHRDVKPPNIFMVADGPTKILDFGIAKLLDRKAGNLTGKGVAIGTPRYMSPEQAEGSPLDGRADLYAVGLVLFEMLSGQSPFEGAEPNEIFIAHLTRQPPRLRSLLPDLPAEVDEIVARLLHKQPEERPPSAGAAAETLRTLMRRYCAAQPGITPTVSLPPALGDTAPMSYPPTGIAGTTQRMPSQRVTVDATPDAEQTVSHQAPTAQSAAIAWGSSATANDGRTERVPLSEASNRALSPTRTSAPHPITPPPVARNPENQQLTTPPPWAHRPTAKRLLATTAVAALLGAAGFSLLFAILKDPDEPSQQAQEDVLVSNAVAAEWAPVASFQPVHPVPTSQPVQSAGPDGPVERTVESPATQQPRKPPRERPLARAPAVHPWAATSGSGHTDSAAAPVRRVRSPHGGGSAPNETASPDPTRGPQHQLPRERRRPARRRLPSSGI